MSASHTLPLLRGLAEHGLEDGLVVTTVPALAPGQLPARLRSFVQAEATHRREHLQERFGYAFDGYSYMGQADSRNQGAEDMLHSFVFSDFFPAERYPSELRPYIDRAWSPLKGIVRNIEARLLGALGLDHVVAQHRAMGHMMSANYYPPVAENGAAANSAELRLAEHPDASLVTVFPFGLDDDFEYLDAHGRWRAAPAQATSTVVAFPGHLLEWMSGGRVKALNHRVRLSEGRRSERFSFALFSLPFPQATLRDGAGRSMAAEEYVRWHLSLWD